MSRVLGYSIVTLFLLAAVLHMIWMAATIALLVTVFQLTINANLTNGPLANGPVLVCIAVYFGCIVIFCIHLYRRFALPGDARAAL